MTRFEDLNRQEQDQKLAALRKDYQEFQAKGLHLDMSRGKPGADQLENGGQDRHHDQQAAFKHLLHGPHPFDLMIV